MTNLTRYTANVRNEIAISAPSIDGNPAACS